MKKNWLIPLFVALLAAILLLVSGLGAPEVDEDMIIISVNGREWRRIPLSQPQEVRVAQSGGAVNVVSVSERGAVMVSSTCDNQLCVHMGEVTVDNWEYRPNQQFIICLPNRVSIELAVKE